ncbi:MAG: hypothetical protein SF028_05170 [Candidatus Sumerlaeia bacterium]|nr:hypothetical protein [Candidatus Sumerlaeia bacterium]
MDRARPDRAELFGFYYLGLRPDGTYKYSNAHQVAAWYRVSSDAVLGWLDEYGLSPSVVARKRIEITGWSVDIQLDLPNLEPEGVRRRVAEAMEAFDEASGGRHPWRDGPIS